MTAVLLLGDSIRMHYQPVVTEVLGPVVPVRGPDENCGSSRVLRASLGRWALDALVESTVVHVNAGLHDLRKTPENGWDVEVPLDEYRSNMAEVLDRLIEHPLVAHVAVATSTPVDERRHNVARHSHRFAANLAAYNVVLLDLAGERGLMLNDLWRAATTSSAGLLSSDGVHLTPEGSVIIGVEVANTLEFLMGGATQARSTCGA
ncbi:MAG: hypothetical protein GWP04_10640 [Gammaproteobacteria bacterium]|nr:hypothetical protein [Gammaproteobacteria bacterium]